MKTNRLFRFLLLLYLQTTVVWSQEQEWSVRVAFSDGFLGVNAGVYADSTLRLGRVTGATINDVEYCESERLEPRAAAVLADAIEALGETMPYGSRFVIGSSCEDIGEYYITVTGPEPHPFTDRFIQYPTGRTCQSPTVLPDWLQLLMNAILPLRSVVEQCVATRAIQ